MIGALLVAASALTPVGVAEREWHLSAYERVVRRGAVRFQVHNFGEDSHDLQVLGPHGYRSAVTPEIRPGENGVLTVHLRRPGSYRLLCVLPGHAARGMRARIRVR